MSYQTRKPSGNQKPNQFRINFTDKTFSDVAGNLVRMTDDQLKAVPISDDGEYFEFDNAQEALDVLNYVKKKFRGRGYAVYVLHDAIWLVPFLHKSLRKPDFAKGIKVLPDFKTELANIINDMNAKPQKKRRKQKATSNKMMKRSGSILLALSYFPLILLMELLRPGVASKPKQYAKA